MRKKKLRCSKVLRLIRYEVNYLIIKTSFQKTKPEHKKTTNPHNKKPQQMLTPFYLSGGLLISQHIWKLTWVKASKCFKRIFHRIARENSLLQVFKRSLTCMWTTIFILVFKDRSAVRTDALKRMLMGESHSVTSLFSVTGWQTSRPKQHPQFCICKNQSWILRSKYQAKLFLYCKLSPNNKVCMLN